MPLPVYSQQLVELHALGSVDVPTPVPAGVVWVVKCIKVFYPDGLIGGLAQLVDATTLTTLFWDTAGPNPETPTGNFRFWNQMHIVMSHGVDYEMSGSGSPDVTLNGYALTVP